MTQKHSGLDRKALKQPDGFVKVGRELIEKLSQNSIFIMTLCGIILVFAVGLGGYQHFHRKSEDEARAAFFKATQNLKTKDGKPGFESVPGFEKVILDFSGTRAGFEAAMTVGGIYYKNDDYKKAIEFYLKANDSAPGDIEKTMALGVLGNAYESEKNFDLAVQTYEEAMRYSVSILKGNIMLGLARSFEGQGNKDQARKTYQAIKKELPNTTYADTADAYQKGN